MKVMQRNPLIIDSLSCILKESWYIAKFLLIDNENQCVPLLFSSSRLMTNAPSFIPGELFLEKAPLNLGS